VVDKNGKLAFSRIYPIEQLPETGELFGVLEQLK
jgi:hypothetical protein